MLVVDQEISNVDALALGRKLPDVVLPAAIRFDHRFCQGRQADRVAAADIERQALGLGRQRGGEECVGRVIDIQKVAALLAAPNLERLAFDDPAQPDTEEGLAGVLDAHSWPVDVGQPQGARLDAVDVAIQSGDRPRPPSC